MGAFCVAPGTAAESPPAHDRFLAPLPLTIGEVVTNSFVTTTLEPGEPITNTPGTLWYSFTSPATRSYSLTAHSDPGFSSLICGIFSGSELTNLTPLGLLEYSETGERGVAFRAVQGTTYKIALGVWPRDVEQSVVLRLAAGHPNDDFPNAAQLSGLFTSWTGGAGVSTAEPDEERAGFPVIAGSIWAKWTAPESGVFAVAGLNPFQFRCLVFRGTAILNLRTVSGYEGRPDSFWADAGETYYIWVTSASLHISGLDLRLGPAVPNELPSTATKIQGTNILAQGQNWTWSSSTWFEQLKNRIWWEWTAPGNGLVTVESSGQVSAFHAKVPTYSSNLVAASSNLLADLADLVPGEAAGVTGGITYRFGVKSPLSTNVTLGLRFQDADVNVGRHTNALLLGDQLWHSQMETFFSAPDALQAGPLATNEQAAIEFLIYGRGKFTFLSRMSDPSGLLKVNAVNAQGVRAEVAQYSGPHDWTARAVDLPDEFTVIRITLSHTGEFSNSKPTAWLDDIEYPAEAPKIGDLLITYHPLSIQRIQLRLEVQAGRESTIETSADLVDWSPWTNLISHTNVIRSFYLYDPLPQKLQFFRARATP